MKKNLFLYLFIFALLINIFTYMYFTNKQKFDDKRIEALDTRVKSLKDSLDIQTSVAEKANFFSLESNYNASQYFEGKDIEAIAIKVRDGIYAQNVKPGGNPLVGYPQMGNPYVINNFKILNNRWIIADFSNGKIQGEVILKYFVEDDGSISYEIAETLLHTNTVNE